MYECKRLFPMIIAALLVSLACSLYAHADGVLYVKPGGTGDGSSWEAALGDPQEAIEAAAVDPDITQVWVAAGTYIPNTRPNPVTLFGYETDPRSVHFSMRNGVEIYGGFLGYETDLSERDFSSNKSIFSGNIGAQDDDLDNAYHVFFHSNDFILDQSAILDGVTITAGAAYGGTWHHSGAGMFNDSNKRQIIRNVTIKNNSAQRSGGGVYNYNSSPTFDNVIIESNTAYRDGGGMYNHTSNPNLKYVIFDSNFASLFGGGLCNNSGSSPNIEFSIIKNNHASHTGGGIYNADNSNPVATNVDIRNNYGAQGGGGVSNSSSRPIFTNVLIHNNTTRFSGGGVYNRSNSNPSFTNVTISNNHSTEIRSGGGMDNHDSNVIFLNSSCINNNADSYGSCIRNYTNSQTNIINSIIWGNSNVENQLYNRDVNSVFNISWSIIQGDYPSGENIFKDDPLLQPLGDNGGFTHTHAIPSHSSAYAIPQSAGSGNWNGAPDTDQRGVPRTARGMRAIGAYEAERSSLKGIILPQAAIDAGAKWRRLGTTEWLNSGFVDDTAPVGQNTVEFYGIDGWAKPGNQTVMVTSGELTEITGTYTVTPGMLQVTIQPEAARTAGAAWRRTGTDTWRNSGYTETDLPSGAHTVEFRIIPGWNTQGNTTAQIVAGQTARYEVTYTANSREYRISASAASDHGTVTGDDIYLHNAWVTLTATPTPGYVFSHWTENGVTVSGAGYVYRFYATANRDLQAHFRELKNLPGVMMLLLDD